MIPAVVFLGVGFWILLSIIKYWYYGKMNIKYANKLDDKVLEDIRRPSKEVLERIEKKYREREYGLNDESQRNFPFNGEESKTDAKDSWSQKVNDELNHSKRRGPPPTIFEEMDLRKKEGNKLQRKPSKYAGEVFDDPLSRLYQDIQKLKRESKCSNTTT